MGKYSWKTSRAEEFKKEKERLQADYEINLQARADEIIRGYNAKVDELIESSKEITGEVI